MIIILIGAVALGVVVASGFLILALLLVPVFLVRLWLHKKQFENFQRAQQAQYRGSRGSTQGGSGHESSPYNFGASSKTTSGPTSRGTTIEGEVVKKSDEQPSHSDPER